MEKEKIKKPKPKNTEKKPKPKNTEKKPKPKVIIEVEKKKEPNEVLYGDKLKNLLFKIKNQNNYNDAGIRFAWKN